MHLLFVLLILLLAARTCAEVAVRFRQPALVGELVGGILIGAVVAFAPASLELKEMFDTDATLQAVLDLAIFFLMLLAGLEMRPSDLAKASGKATPIAIVGMLLPLAIGFGLGWLWLPESDWRFQQSLFIGVALAITAVPVAVKVLLDTGHLQTPVGRVIIAAAVMDDVFSLVLLAVLTAMLSSEEALSAGTLASIGINTAIFFVVVWVAGKFLLPLVARGFARIQSQHAEFSVLILFGLGFSVLAELLDMHFLIGAFAAGVMFTRSKVGDEPHERVQKRVETMTFGLLAPVFFASIGLHLELAAFTEIPLFLALLLFAAIAGKLVGAGLVARVTGFDNRQSLAIGSAMNARGAVEIIIADIALRAGLFDHPTPTPPVVEYLFSAIVVVALVTTLLSPILLRAALGSKD